MFHAIIQARMGSKRLPGKTLMEYKKISPLKVLLLRLKKIKEIGKLIVVTTKNKKDKSIINLCRKLNVSYYKGSANNVLLRYYSAAKRYKSKEIIRLTADNPFIDKKTLVKMINLKKNNNFNYIANTYPLPSTYPDGSDIEIFDFDTLKKTYQLARLPSQKEHVTFFMWQSKIFKKKKINLKKNYSKVRYTVDTAEDFEVFKYILDSFSSKKIFSINMYEIINILSKSKKITSYQKKLTPNFGWKDSFKKDEIFLKKNKKRT